MATLKTSQFIAVTAQAGDGLSRWRSRFREAAETAAAMGAGSTRLTSCLITARLGIAGVLRIRIGSGGDDPLCRVTTCAGLIEQPSKPTRQAAPIELTNEGAMRGRRGTSHPPVVVHAVNDAHDRPVILGLDGPTSTGLAEQICERPFRC